MHAVDVALVVAYLAAVLAAGAFFARRQTSARRYFLAAQGVPWWAIAASVVATETSTITFISVPGIVWAAGGDFRFLQVVIGYVVGRLVIASFFVPWYFRGEILTVYALLQSRFGAPVRALAASLFVVVRSLADGIRLLLTAYVVAAALGSLGGGSSIPGEATAFGDAGVTAVVVALGAVMTVFTLFGGIEAVVWIEVAQLAVYLGGALGAALVLLGHVPLADAVAFGAAQGKLHLFDFSLDLTRTYTFWSGVVGGTFLTLTSHGTDQSMVQRYLCTDRPASAARAIVVSGFFVLAQMAFFLFLGLLLFAFYEMPGRTPVPALPAGAAPDQVFPHFIAHHLPPGLAGLVVAAILAAALSSSLSAIAGTVVADLAPRRPRSERETMRLSRGVIVLAGIAQIAVGVALQQSARSALGTALSIASFVNGPILGVFFLGATRRARTGPAVAGMLAGIAAVAAVAFATDVAWPWYAVVGSLVTLGVGLLASSLGASPTATERAPGAAARLALPVMLATTLAALGCTGAGGCVRPARAAAPVRNGIDVLVDGGYEALHGRRIGLVTNHTGVDRHGVSTIDRLRTAPWVTLVAIFTPEHGLRGTADERVADGTLRGIPVHSLYGERRAPTREQLAGIDTLVFDVQDIGSRFYTYASTMGLAMEAAAAAGVRFMVLDRVNPIGGVVVEGPMLEGPTDFVGWHPLPIRHGLTMGALARRFRDERPIDVALEVIEVDGWKREQWHDATGLPWVNPSPNIRSVTAAGLYPGIGLLERAISVGRGTPTPFEIIGAPYVDGAALQRELALVAPELPGVATEPVRFTPIASTHAGEPCGGLRLAITDRHALRSVDLGVALASSLARLYPDRFPVDAMQPLLRHHATLEAIRAGRGLAEIRAAFEIASPNPP